MTTAASSFRAIVLHTIRHKENGLVLQCYTSRGGRESFYIRYSPRSKDKINISQLHPLAIVEIELSSLKMGTMANIREISSPIRLSSIRGDIYKSSIALFMCELILKSIREVEENPLLYAFLHNSVITLESMKEGVANFHPWFLVNFCGQMGYAPKIDKDPEDALFDIVSAEYVKYPQPDSICMNQADSALLYRFIEADSATLSSIRITGSVRYHFIGELLRYLSIHTGSELKIESLDVLHEVFE